MQKRPAGVWIICIFMFISAAWTFLSLFLVYSDSVPMNAAQYAYFSSLGLIDWISSAFIAALNIAGVIALFMLRRVSLKLLIASFVIAILSILLETVRTNWIQALGGSGLVGFGFGELISLAVIWYTWHLSKKGILK